MDFKEVGQLLMIGVAGPTLTPAEKAFIRKVQPAGVIYFRRNVESPKQLKELSFAIQRLMKVRPPLIGIDQEGGRVARLSSPFTEFPGNDYLGRAYLKTHAVRLIQAQAKAMARELKTIGVNYNFTPVADIHTNVRNPIIGSRSFGTKPGIVSRLVAATVRAYNAERVVSCAKHFPGHGDTASDSHKVLPVVRASKATLLRRELAPFKAAIAADVPTMMTAHVIYPALDPHRPATLSPIILKDLLRKKLGYQGVVVSDDLEMKAIAAHGPIREAAVEAIVAGADLLLVCKSLDESENTFRALSKAVEQSAEFRDHAHHALLRIQKLKNKFLRPQRSINLDPRRWVNHQQLAEKIRQFT